jgi:hypothetical protein
MRVEKRIVLAARLKDQEVIKISTPREIRMKNIIQSTRTEEDHADSDD